VALGQRYLPVGADPGVGDLGDVRDRRLETPADVGRQPGQPCLELVRADPQALPGRVEAVGVLPDGGIPPVADVLDDPGDRRGDRLAGRDQRTDLPDQRRGIIE